MEKKKSRKSFWISVIISVVVLVVLIWCTILINSAAVDRLITGDNHESEQPEIQEEDRKHQENQNNDEPAKEPIKIEDNQSVENGELAKPTDKGEESVPPSKPVQEDTKPIAVPENLPQEEVYSVYNNTLIIGDSRTEGFKLYSGVKNASYFCMKAMTVDKIVEGKQATVDGNSVSVYDMLDNRIYDKVIIGVGLNELGWNHIETFLDYYGTLIEKIKEKQPTAKIYLQAVLPVSRSKNDSDKVHNNAQVYWYNENIVKLAENKGVQFVNPAAALVDTEGFLVTEATTDGIHLNSQYCKIWAKYLAELL